MKNTYNIFFRLLRKALWGGTAEVPSFDKKEGNEVLQLAKRHTVYPLILNIVDPAERKELVYFRILYNYYNSTLCKVLDYLDQNNIRAVLLKGPGISVCYAEPYLRQFGDIDLFVGEENFDKTIALCQELTGEKLDHSTEKHAAFKIDKVSFEIHKFSAILLDPKCNSIYQQYEKLYIKDSLNTILINSREIPVPETTFSMLYIFYHAFDHFMENGIGLRHICDIAVYLNSNFDKIDAQKLRDMLESLGLLEMWNLFLNIIVEYLGLEPKKALFYTPVSKRKVKIVMKLIMDEGNFGQYKTRYFFKSYKYSRLHKLTTLIIKSRRYLLLLQICPKSVMQYYPDYLKTSTKKFFKFTS